ncbi:rab escort protein 1 [Carica papaya]|uniref:rab escort protein 1 n=1 Tax=Carica papaya TaxID=3649 RepID=UPI000B8D1463|nr:rab escort protein 1 [Carica papaya]
MVQVLRMPVTALLLDKDTGNVKGVRLASGQDIFSHKLVLDPSLTLPLASSVSDHLEKSLQVLISRKNNGKVAKGICITRSSVKPDTSNIVVVYPPRSLFPEQVTTVRVVQLGSGLAVCPSGMYILYLSALCDDDIQGTKLLDAAMNTLLKLPVSADPESSSSAQNDDEKVEKPILLWRALYIQELTVGQFETVGSTPMPDGNLTYNCIIEASFELFQQIFPNEEFFPEATSLDNPEDESSLSLDT